MSLIMYLNLRSAIVFTDRNAQYEEFREYSPPQPVPTFQNSQTEPSTQQTTRNRAKSRDNFQNHPTQLASRLTVLSRNGICKPGHEGDETGSVGSSLRVIHHRADFFWKPGPRLGHLNVRCAEQVDGPLPASRDLRLARSAGISIRRAKWSGGDSGCEIK